LASPKFEILENTLPQLMHVRAGFVIIALRCSLRHPGTHVIYPIPQALGALLCHVDSSDANRTDADLLTVASAASPRHA